MNTVSGKNLYGSGIWQRVKNSSALAIVCCLAILTVGCGYKFSAEEMTPYAGNVEGRSIQGVWRGHLRMAGMSHRIVSTFNKLDEGNWTLVFDNPDMGEYDQAIDDVSFINDVVIFRIPSRGATFTGVLEPDGLSIKGKVKTLGVSIPLIMVLVEKPIDEMESAADSFPLMREAN